MKKNFLFMALALCCSFAMTSCSSDDDGNDAPDEPKNPSNGLTIQVTADQKKDGLFYSDDLLFFVNSDDGKTVSVTGKENYYNSKPNDSPKEIIIPQFITCNGKKYTVNQIESYGDRPFENYVNLERITIPETIEYADHRFLPFSGCSALKEPVYNKHLFVKLPSSHQGSYTIPDGIQTLCVGAFSECKDLTDLIFPTSLTHVVGFNNCSLTSITLPSSVTKVGIYSNYNPAWGCPNLTYFDFGDGITEIEVNYLAYDCPKLKTIAFGKNIKKIEANLKSDTKEYLIRSTTPPDVCDWWFDGKTDIVFTRISLRVPAESIEAYKAHPVWGLFKSIKGI